MKRYIFLLFFLSNFGSVFAQPSIFQKPIDGIVERSVLKACDKVFQHETFKKFKSSKIALEDKLDLINYWAKYGKINQTEMRELEEKYVMSQMMYNRALSRLINDLFNGIWNQKQLRKNFLLTDSTQLISQFSKSFKEIAVFNQSYDQLSQKINGTQLRGSLQEEAPKIIENLINFSPAGFVSKLGKDLVVEFTSIDYRQALAVAKKTAQFRILEEFKFIEWEEVVKNNSEPKTPIREKNDSGNKATFFKVNSGLSFVDLEFNFSLRINQSGSNAKIKLIEGNNLNYISAVDTLKNGDKFELNYLSTTPVYLFVYDTEANHWQLLNPAGLCNSDQFNFDKKMGNALTNGYSTVKLSIAGNNSLGKEMAILLFTSEPINISFVCNQLNKVSKPLTEGFMDFLKIGESEISQFNKLKITEDNRLSYEEELQDITKAKAFYMEFLRKN
jgi:hypothetical protein